MVRGEIIEALPYWCLMLIMLDQLPGSFSSFAESFASLSILCCLVFLVLASLIHLSTNLLLEGFMESKNVVAPFSFESASAKSSGTINWSTSSIKFQSPLALEASMDFSPDSCILPSSIS